MSNSYATVPNILPGNVTIGGDLTVGGNTIRVGTASPFVRLQKIPAGGGALGYNRDDIAGATDAASQNIVQRMLRTQPGAFEFFFHDGTGGSNSGILPMIFGWTGVNVNVTGTVAETTVFSVPIRGGFLGANGGLRFWWALTATAQGAGATTFRVKLGATVLTSFTSTTVDFMQARGVTINANAQNAQRNTAWWTRAVGSFFVDDNTTAVDTSVPQTLTFTIQPGAVGDNWNSRQATLEPVRCGA